MASSGDSGKLHALFLPFLSTSHIISLVNAARLFAAQGVKVSIITTKYNTALFQSSIDHAIELGHEIYVHNLNFPSVEMGLPEGIETSNAATTPEMYGKLYMGILRLQEPMEQLIRDLSPHCIFSDLLYPWTADLAQKLKIPRILFYPSNFISRCLSHNLEHYEPQKAVKSDSESFLVPGLPDSIEMKMSQLEDHLKPKLETQGYIKVMKAIKESEIRSFGLVFDTCYEFEPQYADYYEKIRGKKCWAIGPLFHFTNREKSDSTTAEKDVCLNWLDSQEPDKVLYVSFGSVAKLSDAQLGEIALALESSNQPFIWVVRKKANDKECWLPDGFEERIANGNRGLIVRGWGPQLMILSHPAVGGFMTHCGWNSTIEAMTAGVPLITWPLFAEQFYNEKYIEVMKIGVSVGADHWNLLPFIEGPLVTSKQIEDAIKRLMRDSEESQGIRNRAKEMAALAKRAVEKGGSSYENLLSLIRELKSCAFGIKS